MTDAAVPCPSCEDTFDTHRGMRIHHATVHDESLVDSEVATCDTCSQTFEVSAGSTGTYCSRACMSEAFRDRVELECHHCGTTFDVQPEVAADGRKFCSQACYGASLRERTDYVCAGCGREYSVYDSAGTTFCSRACWAEDQTSKPRPGDLDGLLWLLYVYERHSARDTWLRANCARPDDAEWLTQSAVRDRLTDNGWMRSHGAKYGHLSAADLDLSGPPAGGDATWEKYYDRGGAD